MMSDEMECCDRGPCSATKGHEGTCAEASGWADFDADIETCWRSECRNGCYYPGACSVPPAEFLEGRPRRPIADLIEASSFGTPAAKAARESVTDEQVRRVLARAEELRREAEETP